MLGVRSSGFRVKVRFGLGLGLGKGLGGVKDSG